MTGDVKNFTRQVFFFVAIQMHGFPIPVPTLDFSVLYRAVIMAGDFLLYGGWRECTRHGEFSIYIIYIDIDVCVVQIFYSLAKHMWPDHENFLFYASWCTRGLYHEDFSILSRWLWGSLIRLTCYRDFLFYGESRDIRVMTISLYLLTWQTTYVSWNFLFCDIHRRIRSHSGKIFFLFDEGKISYSTAADVNARVT